MSEIASRGQLRAAWWRWVLVLVPGHLLLGFLSARGSGSGPASGWFMVLAKPGLYPPPVVFPLVWSLLYVLMALALAHVAMARSAPGRGAAIIAYGVQLVLNLAWSPVFFGLHRISWALGVIGALALVLAITVALFARVRPLAALLLAPYLAWVLFAGLLNWQFLALNPVADGQPSGVPAVRLQI
ncbi:MAG TPA: TspO/MBR family protein [Novosphingobium sp.]|nr:TspO/MBR family protein [Novosphingobium sp.]